MSENVRPDFYSPSLNRANLKATDYKIENVSSKDGAITGTNLKSKAIFEFSTGTGCVDMFKSKLCMEYTPTYATDFTRLESPCSSAIWKANYYINGKKIRTVDNWPQTRQVASRMTFTKTVNENTNEIPYVGAVNATANSATGAQKSFDSMDAIFMRDSDHILPPGVDVKLEIFFVQTGNGIFESSSGDGTACAATIAVNDFYLIIHRVKANGWLSGSGTNDLHLYSLESENPTVDGKKFKKIVSIEPGLTKIIVAFQDTAAVKSDNISPFNAHIFDWTTSGLSNNSTATDKLITLNAKYAGDHAILDGFDNTYGYRQAFLHFITNTGQDLKDSPESQTDFEKQGPLFVIPISKDAKIDNPRVEITTTWAATPTCYMYVFTMHEVILRFSRNVASGKTTVMSV